MDTSQIAAEVNSYAVSLGFVVDNSLNKDNSGYYSPDYRLISTNEIGTAAARDLVSATKNQLNSRFSESYSPTLLESIFGLVRVNCAVEYSHTDDMGDWYYIYVFMGKSERLKDDFGLLDILSEFCYTIGKQSKGGRQMSVLQKKTEYILMNKDCRVLSFLCIRNEYDEPTFQELQWFVEYRPIGYKTLTGFLERRKAPKHREHIQRLLERFGCDDLEGFLNVTHAVSLNDTFWVKRADRDICWDQVSLYRNEFDQLISEAAFDGSASSSELSTTSPEFGTDGNYAKCWIREDDGIYLYKTGSSRYEVEPLSEFLASQLASILCPSYVDYDLDFYRDKLISKCKLFTTEDLGLAKAAGIFTEDRTIPAMLRYFEELGSGDAFRRMCILDALTFNPDRHYGNFGVLFNTETMEPISMCPVFDNNRSLFPDLDQGQLENPDWYLQKCKPMIGKDFLLTARGLLTPEIRSDLKNLKGFQFNQHTRIEAPQERLEALSAIVNAQINAIIE